MKRGLWLGLGLVALLVVAWGWSRQLVAEVEAPPPSSALLPVASPRGASAPGHHEAPAALPAPAPEAAPLVVAAPGEPQPADAPLPHPTEPTPAEPPAPEADNPFATESSPELDYAWRLVHGPDAGVASARSAAEVFERCLKQFPENRRCYVGLVDAQTVASGKPLSSPTPFVAPSLREVRDARREQPLPRQEKLLPDRTQPLKKSGP